MMGGHAKKLFESAFADYAERERAWWKNDRRGRWVVLEPAPSRVLGDAPAHVRDYVDAITDRRARRFSSLSHARSFAKAIGSEVRRWRRQQIRRAGDRKFKATWRYETNPWALAQRQPGAWLCGVADLVGSVHADE